MLLKKIFYPLVFTFIISLVISSSLGAETKEITLNIKSVTYDFESLDTQNFYVNGKIDLNYKYLMIYTKGTWGSNPISPYMFITKKEFFNFFDLYNPDIYDYTSIQEGSEGNKIIIPKEYFDSNGKNGFYLNVTCYSLCDTGSILFDFVDEAPLNIGEKFSFYSRNDIIDSFIIKLDVNSIKKNSKKNSSPQLFILLNGGDEDQLSFKINTETTHSIYKFPETQGIVLDPNEIEKEYLEIDIKMKKNIKFTFTSELRFPDDTSERNIFIGEYNQNFFIKGNEKECFTVDNSKGFTNDIIHDIIIVSSKDFVSEVTCYSEGLLEPKEFKVKEDEQYVSSEGLKCTGSVTQVCIESKQEDITWAQLHIYQRINEAKTSNLVKRMIEPSLSGISYIYDLDSNDNITNNYFKMHTHSQFYSQNLTLLGINAINVGVRSIKGKLRVFRDLCTTYPYCQMTNEQFENKKKNEKNFLRFREIYPETEYYSYTINSYNDYYSMSNLQSLIVVECIEPDETLGKCTYEINYYSTLNPKKMNNREIVAKYLQTFSEYDNLRKEDVYYAYLHKNTIRQGRANKLVIDLLVYSGDAYFVPLDKDNLCRTYINYLGSNQRIVVYCNASLFDDFYKFDFSVRANNENGAYYSVYVQEKLAYSFNDVWPVETNILESINNYTINVSLTNQKNFTTESYSPKYVTIFNSINCKLQIKNLQTNKEYLNDLEGVIQDVYEPKENENKKYYKYNILKLNDTHYTEQNGLYFVNSFDYNDKNSYLTLQESKPFAFILNKDISLVRITYPFGYKTTGQKLYLRVNMKNEVPIKITAKLGYGKEKTFELFNSKDIIVFDDSAEAKLPNTMNQIKLQVELLNKDQEGNVYIDLNIKGINNTPYSIKSDILINDIVNSNSIQYYLALVNKGSRGSIVVNFKRGTGVVYARLINSTDTSEKGGWNNRINLPDENLSPLKYDSFEQKITFKTEDTNYCEDLCYLVFGVETKNEYLYFTQESSSIFNIFYKYYALHESDQGYIDLQNNEYVTSIVEKNTKDFYKYNIYNDADSINIIFESSYCKFTIGYGTTNFDDKEHTQVFESNGEYKFYLLTKDDVLKKYLNPPEEKILQGLTIYVRIESSIKSGNININELDMRYHLKISTPKAILNNIKIVDSDRPEFCDDSIEKGYCDFIIKLDSYDKVSDLDLSIMSNEGDKNLIYANVITNSQFTRNITQNILPEWPSKEKHHYPKDLTDTYSENYLKLGYLDLYVREQGVIDPIVLIRVYNEEKHSIKLFTSLTNYLEGITPPTSYPQLLTTSQYGGLRINIPSDHDYSCHIKAINGYSTVTINDRDYDIKDKSDTIVTITKKNEENIFYVRPGRTGFVVQNFVFYFWFTKIYQNKNIEEINLGSNEQIIYEVSNFPLNYYVKINKETGDIPFSICLRDLESREKLFGKRNLEDSFVPQNSTESFVISGGLINENELIFLKSDSKKHYVNKLNGNYDKSLHRGYILFDKNEINEFKKTNGDENSIYAYITIDKSEYNNRVYTYINSEIFALEPENEKISTQPNIYIVGSMNGKDSSTKHIYKLNGLTNINSEEGFLKVEFSSSKSNIDVYFGKKEGGSIMKDGEYFGVTKIGNIEDFGKDIYILNKNFSEAYLVIENNKKEDVTYTFKYSFTEVSELEYQYNKKIQIKQKITKETKIKITVDKVKLIKNNTKDIPEEKKYFDYYIRIYAKEASQTNLNKNTIAYKESSPYALYKIDNSFNIISNDEDTFSINVPFDCNEDFYLDIVAENIETKELYSYERLYPKTTPLVERSSVFIMMVSLIIVLIVIIIVLAVIAKIYKRKKESLESKVNEISFFFDKEKESDKEEEDKLKVDDKNIPKTDKIQEKLLS